MGLRSAPSTNVHVWNHETTPLHHTVRYFRKGICTRPPWEMKMNWGIYFLLKVIFSGNCIMKWIHVLYFKSSWFVLLKLNEYKITDTCKYYVCETSVCACQESGEHNQKIIKTYRKHLLSSVQVIIVIIIIIIIIIIIMLSTVSGEILYLTALPCRLQKSTA